MPEFANGEWGRELSLAPREFPPLDAGYRKGLLDPRNPEVERIAKGGRFLTVKKAGENESMLRVSPFLIARELHPLGEVKDITRLRDGTIVIETKSREQALRMMRVNKIGSHEVKVEEHPRFNTSKGVIRSWDLAYMDENELLSELSSQMVTEIRQIKRKPSQVERRTNQNAREGASAWMNTGTFIVTFALPEIPAYIKAGYLKVNVAPFVPNPLRCFKCQKYGHMKTSCRGVAMCGICADREHYPEACTGEAKCINCGQNHVSWSRKCPVFQAEFEIQKIRVYNKISFAEAKRRFIERMGREGETFSNVTKRQTSFGVNCEHCKCQCGGKRNVPRGRPAENPTTNPMTNPKETSQARIIPELAGEAMEEDTLVNLTAGSSVYDSTSESMDSKTNHEEEGEVSASEEEDTQEDQHSVPEKNYAEKEISSRTSVTTRAQAAARTNTNNAKKASSTPKNKQPKSSSSGKADNSKVSKNKKKKLAASQQTTGDVSTTQAATSNKSSINREIGID
ncbi:uncharacterized protein LOC129794306 [Lutzomyia longipalpis]|uniref:uncharacterized protein LOC129794306 n=1 Tax=Lutzomyia longipalpis TaxID=7200 RepID=UPI00248436E6|nr:uncharacterized protein LOC129794306 [Lutzomyia longipalpis]